MRARKRFLGVIIPFLYGWSTLAAQTDFYDETQIQEIRITFQQANWDEILDSLFLEDEDGRLEATVEINGERLERVGIRYKGYSSASVDRVKNPFNIELDYILDNQRYQTYDKVRLSNVIQDPSFVREVLSYHIARNYMPASKANFANLYINDSLWGLYSNVESVNKDFAQTHFGSRNNPFFKGNPTRVNLNGENANLSMSPGTDTTDYYPYYSMESDDGWKSLLAFIDTLNNHPESIEQVLNVDRTLWMHALNYTLLNFDSYIGYAQNYYLYQDDHGQFNPILWDLNMSIGSFRLTDASTYWSGFNIQEAKTIDPLSHYNSVSVFPRPLLRNLFQNDTYRRMYLAHIRTIVEEQLLSQIYAVKAQELQNLIDASVANDPNKFYSYQAFLDNLDTTVTDLISYPGITDLLDARAQYLSSYPGYQGAPTITDQTVTPTFLHIGDSIWANANVAGATSVSVAYRSGGKDLFRMEQMFDDGQHNDGAAGDGNFGFLVPGINDVLQYYYYAENDSAGEFWPHRAAYEYFSIEPQRKWHDIVINEIKANNQNGAADPDGETEDWIELYNNTESEITLEQVYLSNEAANPTKWLIPNTTLQPKHFLIIWADNDTTQQGLHTNFKLDAEKESIYLSYPDGTFLDSVSYSHADPITSVGRFPNGIGPMMNLTPTIGKTNDFTFAPILTDHIFIFPNPTDELLNIKINSEQPSQIQLFAMDGKQIMQSDSEGITQFATLDLATYAPGIYLLRVENNEFIETTKVVIY